MHLYRLWKALVVCCSISTFSCGDSSPKPVPESSTQLDPSNTLAPQVTESFLRARPHQDVTFGGNLWQSLGPAPISDGQVENLQPASTVTGAVHALAPHPSDPNTLYIGTVNGGIWVTRNARDLEPRWTVLTDGLPSQSIGALAFDPLDGAAETLLAGLGNVSSYGQSGLLRGLLYSRNGGRSWRQLDDELLAGTSVIGVAARGRTLLAAATSARGVFDPGGIFRSEDRGTTWTMISGTQGLPAGDVYDLVQDSLNPRRLFVSVDRAGIFRSDDTGATWRSITATSPELLALFNDRGLSNCEMAIASNGRVYANLSIFGLLAYVGYTDNGTAWTRMDRPFTPESEPKVIVTVSNTTPIVIESPGHGLSTGLEVEVRGVQGTTAANGTFIVLADDADRFTLFRSVGNSDYLGGGTWRLVSGLNPKAKAASERGPFGAPRRPGGQGGIHSSIIVDPTNPNIIYIGGDRQDFAPGSFGNNFIGASNFTGRLFRGDARVTATAAIPSPQWAHLTHRNDVAATPTGGTASSSAPHADSRDMAFDASGELIEADDGGVYRRTQARNNQGDWFSMVGDLQITELHNIAWDNTSNEAVGGAQDVGTPIQSAGTRNWVTLTQGDGADVSVDDTSLADQAQSIRYTGFPGSPIAIRSLWSDAGELLSFAFPALQPLEGSEAIQGTFTTPVELNTVDPRRVLIGASNAVFESLDQGETVRSIGIGISGFQNAMVFGGTKNGVPNPALVYYGSGSRFFVRTAAEASALPSSSPFPGSEIRDIAVSPLDWSMAYVADATGVFVTRDAGASWTNVTSGLVDASLRSLAVVPLGPNLDFVFAGGLGGVRVALISRRSGGPLFGWLRFGTNLPTAPVWDLDYDAEQRRLTVATLGRGAWQANFTSDDELIQ